MSLPVRRDLNISGVLGGSEGGIFNIVSINGLGKIEGDIDCVGFVCNGKASIRGFVQAEHIVVNGSSSFRNVDTGKMRINGRSDFAGVVQCAGEFRIDGYAKVGSQLTCEQIGLNGFLSVKGNCSAESFESRGSFRIQGLLNAGTIDIELHSECRAREIGGDRIFVRKSRKANPVAKLLKALTFNSEQLTAETIEGDDIQLEYTKADIVRGNHVSIGPGCEIGLVEYSGKFAQHQDAKVKDSRKI